MLGLVVNPVAGVGGPAGLAGSDGAAVQREAALRGARPRAAERARLALETMAFALGGPDAATRAARSRVLTAAGAMGEDVVRAAGLEPHVVYVPAGGAGGTTAADTTGGTTAADTTAAVRALVAAGARLVLFAGGDGTARDVAAGLDPAGHEAAGAVAALGIPAGVKMYSPVFAVSPRAAGGLAVAWLDAAGGGAALPVQEREVLDVDEAQLRVARVEPRLYGSLRVPYRAGRTQSRKAPTPVDERAAVEAAARGAVRAMRPGVRYLLGPGGTMAELARALGVPKTALGVDVVLDGRVVRAAASESELLAEIALGPARAVVSVIGGQGFLLGRGNQQLSARVIAALGAGRANDGGAPTADGPLLVVAPEQKLLDLAGRPLLVDTGDPAVDAALAGYVRVITGPASSTLYPVHAPEADLPGAPAAPPATEGEGHAP